MNTKSKFVLMIVAVASITIALTIQQQDLAAFNDNNQFVRNHHDHTNCGTDPCTGNEGTVTNDDSTHTNDNFNSHRDETQKFHSHDKPNNDK
jgi:Ni/Co efflux regulator RcnB